MFSLGMLKPTPPIQHEIEMVTLEQLVPSNHLLWFVINLKTDLFGRFFIFLVANIGNNTTSYVHYYKRSSLSQFHLSC